jgi:hypothetical protein
VADPLPPQAAYPTLPHLAFPTPYPHLCSLEVESVSAQPNAFFAHPAQPHPEPLPHPSHPSGHGGEERESLSTCLFC